MERAITAKSNASPDMGSNLFDYRTDITTADSDDDIMPLKLLKIRALARISAIAAAASMNLDIHAPDASGNGSGCRLAARNHNLRDAHCLGHCGLRACPSVKSMPGHIARPGGPRQTIVTR